MKVLQINAIYEKFSTGRNTKEMHEYFLAHNMESYVASPELNNLNDNCYKIGNIIDQKIHALFSRFFGLQGYFSYFSTKKLLDFIENIQPDIIILGNLHGNYINLPLLLKYIGKKNIATVLVLHDSWFYTGKCVYYVETGCMKWKYKCGNCPALKQGNVSFFFDKSSKMLEDKKELFSKINKLAIVGVSKWVTNDAKLSILRNAKILKCIYNWIDLDEFKLRDNIQLKNELGLENKFIVLGVSTFWSEQKGISVFLKLAELLPDNFQIILAGNYSMVNSNNEKIMFLGSINNIDYLAQLYNIADIFLNPTMQETFGKTTAEALASGTPIVAYNGTATPELIGYDEKCGYLINDLNPESYKDAIIKIYEDGTEKYKYSCINRAQQLFGKEENLKQYIELFNTLLED
ncbi:glycosyltransferase [Thomasclavelia sp.]